MPRMHARRLQLVPRLWLLHPPHPVCVRRPLPLPHERAGQLPRELLQQDGALRLMRHVHARLFLLLVRRKPLLWSLGLVLQPASHRVSL